MLTHLLDGRRRKRADGKSKLALMHGLYDELNGLLTTAKPDPSEAVAQEMYDVAFGMTQDYFTVYEAGITQIMQLENDELRRLIVKTYTLGKLFVGMTRINQQCLERLHYLQSTYSKTRDPEVRTSIENYQQIKARLVREIKAADERFHASAQRLMESLAREGKFSVG